MNESNQKYSKDQDVAERMKLVEALSRLASSADFRDFKQSMKTYLLDLANLFNADVAFVGLFGDESQSWIKTVKVLVKGQFSQNFTYALKGTPCNDVLDGKIEIISRDVSKQYPEDKMLTDMNIESYFGAPLLSPSQETIGIIAVMGESEMYPQDWIYPSLAVYSRSIAHDICINNYVSELDLAASVFDCSSEGIVITDDKGNILKVNNAFERITGFAQSEAIGNKMGILKSGRYDQEYYKKFWSKIVNQGVWSGELWNKNKAGEEFAVFQTINTIKNANQNIINFISIFADITERKISEEKLFQLTYFEPLTGLPNRDAFIATLTKSIANAKRNQTKIALIVMNIDRFKLFNDSSGRRVGDQLLIDIGKRFNSLLREGDYLAHLGGDEFAIILENIAETIDITEVIGRIRLALSDGHLEQIYRFLFTVSMGISIFPNDAIEPNALCNAADAALHRSKEIGPDTCHFFESDMTQKIIERIRLEHDLRVAIEKKNFELHYQPQVDLKTGKIVGLEALIRWRANDNQLISPDVFIPIAEETKLIVPIGEWVLHEACAQYEQWLALGIPPFRMAINLSGIQFQQSDFNELIVLILNRYNILPENLDLEITETILMDQIEDAILSLEKLKALGVKISIDDFGTGYSSMAYLKKFPVDSLKIDKSFIMDALQDSDDSAIVEATVALAHSLRYTVIAEGVETQGHVDFLKRLGCDEYQGYFFSKPIPQKHVAAFLIEQNTTSDAPV